MAFGFRPWFAYKRYCAMRHVSLFAATATIVFLAATPIRADSLQASNSGETGTHDTSPAVNNGPADTTPAPAVVPPPSPVAESTADPGMKGPPQEEPSAPIQKDVQAVEPPRRPVHHRVRLGCLHRPPRVAKRAMHPRVAASPARVWLAASREPLCSSSLCARAVLLGVGY